MVVPSEAFNYFKINEKILSRIGVHGLYAREGVMLGCLCLYMNHWKDLHGSHIMFMKKRK